MVSLTLNKKDVAGILRHVYLCLGKEIIAYQDLVFFMAYDLLLFPPSTCEKVIGSGKGEGFLSISPDKIVQLNIAAFDQERGTDQSRCVDIIKAFSDESTLNKAVLLKKNRILDAQVSEKGLHAIALGEQGQRLNIRMDRQRKTIHQDHDEDVAAFSRSAKFLKYLIKILIGNMQDARVQDLLVAVNDQKDKWAFTYARVEGG